jgi:predicted nucleic acid-binding protein
MDVELLLGDAPFIADTSARWRFSSLPAELAGFVKQAVGDDRLWITPIVRMEILYSARSTSEYTAIEAGLDGFRVLRDDRAVADAAMSAVGELAEHSDGYHRVPLTDALITAAAAEHGGVALLHRDTHFYKLAEVLTFESIELPGSWPADLSTPPEPYIHATSFPRDALASSSGRTLAGQRLIVSFSRVRAVSALARGPKSAHCVLDS